MEKTRLTDWKKLDCWAVDFGVISYVNHALKKMTKLPFVGYGERTIEILALVQSICGPFDIPVREDFLYFITFIDDFLWYGYMYFMCHQSEVFEKFKEFGYEVEK